MIIEIKGVEFSNKGAELMLLSIVAALEERVIGYELVLSPGHLLPYLKRAKLGAYQKFSFKFLGIHWEWLGNLAPANVRRLLRHFGIVVEKDIDVVLDASGFVYSDQWSGENLKQTFKHLKRIEKYNTRCIFLPQAFGPFDVAESRRFVKILISKAALIIARDEQSFASLNSLVSSAKIRLFPDFTPLLTTPATTVPTPTPTPKPGTYACVIPNSKMFHRKSLACKAQYLDYIDEIIKIIDSMGLNVILLNHEGEKDHKMCLDIVARSRVATQYLNDLSALEIKSAIGLSVFCVSSRYHGCVSGLSQGVPTIGTSWSHKYEELYRYYQCPDHILNLDQGAGAIRQKLVKILDDRDSISTRLLAKGKEHRELNQEMWALVCKEIAS